MQDGTDSCYDDEVQLIQEAAADFVPGQGNHQMSSYVEDILTQQVKLPAAEPDPDWAGVESLLEQELQQEEATQVDAAEETKSASETPEKSKLMGGLASLSG